MDLRVILRRIDLWLAAHPDRTDADVSRAATGSPDTIRNWRRRAREEEKPGASIKTVSPVATAMGVSLQWLQGEGPDDPSVAQPFRSKVIASFDRLPEAFWPAALDRMLRLEEAARDAGLPQERKPEADKRRR